MQSIFSPDSKFMRGMSRFADLMLLNCLFLLTSVPIFTIGASATALYTVCFRMGTAREDGIFRAYFRSFRDNFKQATALWLLLLLAGVITGTDLLFFYRMSGGLHYVFLFFAILLAVVLLVAAYAFPLLSQFENGNQHTLKNALVLSLGYLPRSILMVFLGVFPFYWLVTNLYVFLTTAFLWVFLYFAAVAYLNTRLLKKVFAPYRPEEEEEAL